MSKILKTTYIQSNLSWENREDNLRHFTEATNSIEQDTDIIVLPEMFSSGFTFNFSDCAEESMGESIQWAKKMAHQKNCVITGSLLIHENGSYYNRMIWMLPDGTYEYYDKKHLFRMAGEHDYMTPGKEKCIVNYKGWKICLMICYDLRFPVWCKNNYNTSSNSYDYDMIVFVANWPASRSYPWKSLLIARAIENQCYVLGVNRTGADGRGVDHSGDSMLINSKGDVLSAISPNKEEIKTSELCMDELELFREKFKVALDWDKFTIKR